MNIQHSGAHNDSIGYGPWWFSAEEVKVIKPERFWWENLELREGCFLSSQHFHHVWCFYAIWSSQGEAGVSSAPNMAYIAVFSCLASHASCVFPKLPCMQLHTSVVPLMIKFLTSFVKCLWIVSSSVTTALQNK